MPVYPFNLDCQPAIASLLNRYGNNFVPFVLIGLGVFIVLDSASLTPIALTACCVGLAAVAKLYAMNEQSTEATGNSGAIVQKI